MVYSFNTIGYLYTVQGWIKGINADRLTAANAQGFAMELDYFSGDYTNVNGTLAGNGGGTGAAVKYNGLVRSQTWRTEKPSGAAMSDATYAYRYTYDSRNQLSNAEFGTVVSGNFQSQGNVFLEGQLSYDVNGNILTLARYNSTGGLLHDFTGSNKFQYGDTRTEYPLGLSNQLVQVPGYASYGYNSIGQMTSQTMQGSPAVSKTYGYTASGLLNTVSSGGQPLVSYTYDASDAQYLRLHYDNSTGQLARSTYYVRDVTGNILAIYEQQSTDPAPVLSEYQLYGSGRIGQYRREGNVFAYVYELKDHVGSVRVLLWQNEASSTASIYSFSDYYPYGLRMQNFNDLTYRYGYQGEYSEYDQDTKLNHFQLRDYDPVIGRWTGIDPYREFYSGYVGMGNNPGMFVDPDGGYSKVGAWIRSVFNGGGQLHFSDMHGENGEWGYGKMTDDGAFTVDYGTKRNPTVAVGSNANDFGQSLSGNVQQINFNVDNAVSALNKNAEASSCGSCAKYVRYALEAGGVNTIGRPRSAKDYVPFLLGKGFKKVSSATLNPIKGDIAVMDSFMGLSKNHPHGHIQMYNGKQWVSDFKQNAFWPGKDYKTIQPRYTILRWQ